MAYSYHPSSAVLGNCSGSAVGACLGCCMKSWLSCCQGTATLCRSQLLYLSCHGCSAIDDHVCEGLDSCIALDLAYSPISDAGLQILMDKVHLTPYHACLHAHLCTILFCCPGSCVQSASHLQGDTASVACCCWHCAGQAAQENPFLLAQVAPQHTVVTYCQGYTAACPARCPLGNQHPDCT